MRFDDLSMLCSHDDFLATRSTSVQSPLVSTNDQYCTPDLDPYSHHVDLLNFVNQLFLKKFNSYSLALN